MAYTKTTWVSGETALSADNMNNIEDGIEELDNNKISGVTNARNVAITATADTLFEVPYSGWLYANATTNSGETLAPFFEIQTENTLPLASSWGSTATGAMVAVAAPVKAGQKYKIKVSRCTLSTVRLHY